MNHETIPANLIRDFVEDFYKEIRRDSILGPLFEEHVDGAWDHHFGVLTNFWLTVLFGVRAYKGNPFAVHQAVKDTGILRLEAHHFGLWLDIFEKSATRKLPPPLADKAASKARKIADSLKQGLFTSLKAN